MFVSVHRFHKSLRSLIFLKKVDPQKWMSSVEYFENEEIGVTLKALILMRGLWSVKTVVFVVSFSLSWVIGNTVLLKGVEVKLRKSFQVMLISKSYTYQSLRVKPLEISYSSVNFFSDRDKVLLVSEEFVLIEVIGICQCKFPTIEEHDSPGELRVKIPTVAVLCASCPKISTHLTVISLKGIYVLSCWAAP